MMHRCACGLGVIAVTMALTTSALAQNVDWRLHNLDGGRRGGDLILSFVLPPR